jgi:eukaryotic-like serine/threonine-protein kinase
MTLPRNTKLTPEVARDVCVRSGSKAYVTGAIANLGSEYVLAVRAVNCQTGDVLAEEQVTAEHKEQVLSALGNATAKLRSRLGESLATVEKFDMPLPKATTSSLEALKAYSLGQKARREKGSEAALAYHQQAIQLDPNFALGYLALGDDYATLGEIGRAGDYLSKAFQLRDNASEWERLLIAGDYYSQVTGELDKAAQNYQEMIDSYPRDPNGFLSLSTVYGLQGEYEKAIPLARQATVLAPDHVAEHEQLASVLLAAHHFDEALEAIRGTQARKLDDFVLHGVLYAIAFLRSDSSAMAQQQQWYTSSPALANVGLTLASDTQAYAGHLNAARELTKRAVDSAIQADSKENGAIWWENAALREAAFGNLSQAREAAASALRLAPASQGAQMEAALAFAMSGDAGQAKSLAQDLNKSHPLDTQIQSLWLPAIKGQLALSSERPAEAINDLQPALPPIEYGQIVFVANLSCLYPTYIRGQAYLAVGQATAAAAEFQKILDHSGVAWNCWTGALARLGVARANASQAKNSIGTDADLARTRALAAYKDFLSLWKDADPEIPIYKQAKAEYAKLQ